MGERVDLRWGQRLYDAAILLILLPLLAPVGLLVAAAVFVDSPGSVLYRARRIGAGGRAFEMLKFRTMKSGSVGPGLTRANDERFTPVGSFLARTRLDELPQLWNVLRGEMRLVGPRPEDPDFVALHRTKYGEILTVPPGITGITQLTHFQDALDAEDPHGDYERILPGKLALDISYVRSRNLAGDLLIVARTLLLPLRLATAGLRVVVDAHRPAAPHLSVGATSLLLMVALLTISGPAR